MLGFGVVIRGAAAVPRDGMRLTVLGDAGALSWHIRLEDVGGLEGGVHRIPAKHREAAGRPELGAE
jgi:hypothetical protein